MSAQSQNLKNNIFISYSHFDRDWVDAMHVRLASRLAELLGEKPEIWRDLRLKKHEAVVGVLVVELAKTAFLVSVLSPGYIKSRWCLWELDEFCRNAAKSGGIRINNKSRIFKVIKSPIENLKPPLVLEELLKECLDYEFYERETPSGRLNEFRPDLGSDSLFKFYNKIEDLSIDIRDFVTDPDLTSQQTDSQSKIYLAETTPDLIEKRNEIKRELQLYGYRVLPDDNLPFEDSAFKEKVKSYLEMSTLSIHLIGADETTIPEEEHVRAKLNLQYHMAADRAIKQHELALDRGDMDSQSFRLIWMPEGLESKNDDYKEFLTFLQNDPGVAEGAEVWWGTGLEHFKTRIKMRLKHREENVANGHHKRIYLICDRQDMPEVTPLRDYLTARKYEVLLPFKEDSAVVSGHKENIRMCDAALFFYGSLNTIDYKLREFRRIELNRDRQPLLAKGVYVSGPETDQKNLYASGEALVMKNFGAFSPESIKPWLEQIERSSEHTPA